MAFLEMNQCREFARLHRLRVLSCQQKHFACLVTKSSESEKTEVSRHSQANSCPINEYGVPLIPNKLRSKLFSNVSRNKHSEAATKQAKAELIKFGLIESSEGFRLPDVTPYLPEVADSNISHHLWRVASDQVRPYTDLLLELLAAPSPPRPLAWALQPGWSRYCPLTGEVSSVPYPEERCLVFDVETAVREDPRAVMAVALTSQAWYSWLSPQLLHGEPFPSGPKTPCSMIPLGSDSEPRLVIGHNVAYDRIRVGDEYRLERSGTRYLDTMSLHIATAGMTSSQRMMWLASRNCTKEEMRHKPRWLRNTTMNSLAEVYKFYCGEEKTLDKDIRNSFVRLSMAELRDDLDTLLTYCAGDVSATTDITRSLYPLFSEMCPHPASLAGMLTMSTSTLPTSNCWDEFLDSADTAYDDMQGEMVTCIREEAELALMTVMDNGFRQDPWLWDLEWKLASQKTIKGRLMKDVHSPDSDMGLLFEEGYPTWYQDLVESKNGAGHLNLSTSKKVVPKLLRLTWKGYPLHHDKKEKWGYLIPASDSSQVLEAIECGEIETSFPLRQFLEVIDDNFKPKSLPSQTSRSDEMFDAADILSVEQEEEDSLMKKKSKPKKRLKTDEVGIDIGIPGVRFCGLPHKNGPKYRVGNPLAKDFMSSVLEGGELASYKPELAEKLLKINICLSYWRSSRNRITEQVKVNLNPSSLPDTVTSHDEFDKFAGYGIIIPGLVAAGTITRRAVEKTWLTASNAKSDRIGSELKCYVRAPPGHHFVGADVDSQELWLASILGDAMVGEHGATPLGWMCLQGDKAQETDLHSKTAAAAQVTRDQAKVLNYGRIYGAGEPFARLLLMQFNPSLSDKEAADRAKHMYQQTKGIRGYLLNSLGTWVLQNFSEMINLSNRGEILKGATLNSGEMSAMGNMLALIKKIVIIDHDLTKCDKLELTDAGVELFSKVIGEDAGEIDVEQLRKLLWHIKSRKTKKFEAKCDYDTKESLVARVVWHGGSESATFNRLEEIAMSLYPATPVLKAEITKALDSRLCGRNFLTSRINWVVQSSAVDFLHLLLVTVEWLFGEMGVRGRLVISIHDEIRYLVVSEDRYKASLALHLANLLVRCEVSTKLGLDSLPASTAFFSSVDVDTVLRKEPSADCVTPSNKLGLELGHGIPRGEGLDIWQTVEKVQETKL